MLELVNNTATALTLMIAVSLPLLTLVEFNNANVPKRKIQEKQVHSMLELPLNTTGYDSKQLEQLEQMNFELNGLLTVVSTPMQIPTKTTR